ncbi:hypothetical protein [Trichococcus ilyis]|jgi:hypothetical protein|nr:hypothetical protein [Trichococcus ilyis]
MISPKDIENPEKNRVLAFDCNTIHADCGWKAITFSAIFRKRKMPHN